MRGISNSYLDQVKALVQVGDGGEQRAGHDSQNLTEGIQRLVVGAEVGLCSAHQVDDVGSTGDI